MDFRSCPLFGIQISVLREGLEPSRLAALAPKASVSAIPPPQRGTSMPKNLLLVYSPFLRLPWPTLALAAAAVEVFVDVFEFFVGDVSVDLGGGD